MTKDELIDKLWEQSNHGTRREDIEAAYNAGADGAFSENVAATKWIKVTEALPNAGEVVLIYTNETNVFGRNGELMRAHVATFCQCDQGGNNLLPFRWQGDGPCSWFGQQVTHWARIIPPHQAT